MFGWFSDGEHFGFALEAGEPVRDRSANDVGQDLDRDLALQLRVVRAVDLAHAAGADLGGDFVRAEAGAGSQGQTWRIFSSDRRAKRGLVTNRRAVAIWATMNLTSDVS